MFILQRESYCSIKKREKKMIGQDTRLRENDDLPLWRVPAIKKKPPFFNVRPNHALRSNDAQCNTKE